MRLSVVVPTYSEERYDDFCECVESLLSQTYGDVEIVIIVDGNSTVYEMAVRDYGDQENVVIYCNHDDAGPISRANMGVVRASGDLVALTDDDAVPAEDWAERLVETQQRHDALAVGGRIDPEWVAGEADYIPEEFYFLIGATHRGFRKDEGEVRNTFGANIAFDRDTYLKLGGIKQGGIDPSQVQGRETEYCARMRRAYGQGVVYNPDAVVYHKIYDYRTRLGWLLKRAFWQGYSKRAMSKLVPNSGGEESDQLKRLLFEFIPGRVTSLIRRPSLVKVKQLVTLLLLLAFTGLGFLYGLVRWR